MMGQGLKDTVQINVLEYATIYSRNNLASEANRSFALPSGMTLHNLVIQHSNGQAVSGQVCTVRLAGADTSLALTIPTTGTIQTINITDRVHANLGDLFAIEFDSPTGSTAAEIISWCLLGDLDG